MKLLTQKLMDDMRDLINQEEFTPLSNSEVLGALELTKAGVLRGIERRAEEAEIEEDDE